MGSYQRKNTDNFLPHKTPIIQPATLNAIYSAPKKYAFFSSNASASSEKVENVVKPPHTPVFQNKIAFADMRSFFATIPVIAPINRAPSRLVSKVSTGNSVFVGIRLIAYLPIAPSAPPKATKKKLMYGPHQIPICPFVCCPSIADFSAASNPCFMTAFVRFILWGCAPRPCK